MFMLFEIFQQVVGWIGNPTIKMSSETVFGFSDDLLDGRQVIQF